MEECANCSLPIRTETEHKKGHRNFCGPCSDLRDSDRQIWVSPLSRDDLELVLAWRSNPKIYRYFQQQDGPLEWDKHIDWYESRDPNRHDFVVHFEERRVGVVSVDSDDEVTVYLGDFAAHGEGVATVALKWLCKRFADRIPLYADIHEENVPSQKLFERCSFRKQDDNTKWLRYIYDP